MFQLDATVPSLFSAPISAGQTVMGSYKDIASQEAVTAYFQELLDLKGSAAQDSKGILELMEYKTIPFREIAENFHLIDSATRTVYIPLDEGADLVEQFRSGERTRLLYRQLGKYGVSVYDRQFNALMNAAALELLEDGSAILLDTSLYNRAFGLTQDIEEGNLIML